MEKILSLEDNVSVILKVPKEKTIKDIVPSIDPDYFFDLKAHLQENLEYRKERIEYHKKHPRWCMYRTKHNFAKEYVKTFHKDIYYHVRANKDLTPEESAKLFCKKWRGYAKTYGEEFTRRAIARCLQDPDWFIIERFPSY